MFNENEVKSKMEKVIENLNGRYSTVRAGRANPNILNGVMVEYYGVATPISSIANITIPEARQLMIKPFDKSSLKNIEKSLYEANLGMAPTNNGEVLILTIPELTEETRKTFVKQVKDMTEEAKIALRNVRQDVNNWIKKQEYSENEEKIYLDQVQEIINTYNKKVEDLYNNKEKELMTV